MARYQSPSRSDEEWFRIINECRRSGLSDSQWCKQHDIRESSKHSTTSTLSSYHTFETILLIS